MNTKKTKNSNIDAQQVSDFLQANPNFLIENLALLRDIEIKANVPEGVSSLIEYQVAALREQNKNFSQSIVNIRDYAKANEKVWNGVYEFLLLLMGNNKKIDSKPYWVEVSNLLKTQFHLDRASSFCLTERNRSPIRQFLEKNTDDEARSRKAFIINRALVEELSHLVFKEESGSMVLFNVNPKKERVIILASNDQERYSEELGTAPLERIVDALRVHAGV